MGLAEEINNIGSCYTKGTGVKKDEKKTFEYYKKSAKIKQLFIGSEGTLVYSFSKCTNKFDC